MDLNFKILCACAWDITNLNCMFMCACNNANWCWTMCVYWSFNPLGMLDQLNFNWVVLNAHTFSLCSWLPSPLLCRVHCNSLLMIKVRVLVWNCITSFQHANKLVCSALGNALWVFNLWKLGGIINRGKHSCGSIDWFESIHYAHSNWDLMPFNELDFELSELGSTFCDLIKFVSNNNWNIWLGLLLWLTLLCIIVDCNVQNKNGIKHGSKMDNMYHKTSRLQHVIMIMSVHSYIYARSKM